VKTQYNHAQIDIFVHNLIGEYVKNTENTNGL